MKRKIILSLLTLFLFSALGVGIATLYILNTTSTLSSLINLHQIEDLRQNLVMSIQSVQSDLYAVNTTFGRTLDSISENVNKLDESAGKCSSCHHAPEVARNIEDVQKLVLNYQNALSYYITASNDTKRITQLKIDAAAIGNQILVKTEEMSARASSKLETMTASAMGEIKRAWIILAVTIALTLLFGIFVAIHLTRSITRPISNMVNATRMIAAGDLGYSIDTRDTTEFGELAKHFNSMSSALKGSYTKLEKEIEERRQTETALVKSEAFLGTIFDSIRDPFCIIDRNFKIIRANEAYAHMKNTRLSDLVWEVCYEVLYKRDSVCDDCIIHKTFLSGDSCAKDKMVAPRSGTEEIESWFEIYTYPILDASGSITHVVEYIRDITGRKRAEEALRESEERYALAARGANDGLWDWDLRGKKIHYSYRWKSMLGYGEREIGDSPEEWIGKVHPDDRKELEARLASHIDGHNSHFESEYRIRHKDGTYRWMLNRGLAVRTANNYAYRMAGSQTDITSRKTAEEQLVYDAFHDALTGLPNRALFMDRLQHVIVSAHRRADYVYAVLFLDMDRFKVVNDSLGHTVGDQLLITVGNKLSRSLRPGDTVARLGGDEFAILLENIGQLTAAIEIAERIQKELSEPLAILGHEIFTSASIGIALSSPDYERPEQILRDADIAMYQAKAKGASKGNACYEVFDSRMHANILERLQLEADLRRAVDHKEFVLHYQPIIDLQVQKLIGFEALIRWNHPEKGMIHPLEFIPVAEENGLINIIGEWIMHEACHQLAVWQAQYPQDPPLQMSMNISSKQFSQPDLVDKLNSILKENKLTASSLALEITESMIMDNIDTAILTMERLREMGFHIHIDDFGTGYSSLSYLHRFPVTALKIDKSFVSKMSANGDNQEVITSIISLASSLNLHVIAEGLELTHQLSGIKDLQCQYGQGFLFAKPMNSDAIDTWIASDKPHVS